MTQQAFLGIDPGLHGALALYAPGYDHQKLWVVDTPTLLLKKGKGVKRFIDYGAFAGIVREWSGAAVVPPIAVVELVSAWPGQGVASAFDFGRSVGAALMACHAHQLRVEQVAPTVWKRAVGIPVGAGKDQSRARAMNLFPADADRFRRAHDDGRAEAALIAWYGARTFTA